MLDGQRREIRAGSALRVRGVERLRVIDASVMPQITSANTNASSLMIGERGAALVTSWPYCQPESVRWIWFPTATSRNTKRRLERRLLDAGLKWGIVQLQFALAASAIVSTVTKTNPVSPKKKRQQRDTRRPHKHDTKNDGLNCGHQRPPRIRTFTPAGFLFFLRRSTEGRTWFMSTLCHDHKLSGGYVRMPNILAATAMTQKSPLVRRCCLEPGNPCWQSSSGCDQKKTRISID
jgi:hypothetical protein